MLYWTLLHDRATEWNGADPLASAMRPLEPLRHDDGFRAPDDDPAAVYVTWDGEETHHQCIFFLHGALHLYDHGHELQKKCWERSGGIPLVDQIRASLDEGRFPLFVSEGNTRGNSSEFVTRPIYTKGFVASPKFAAAPEPASSFSVTPWLPTMLTSCGRSRKERLASFM